MKRVFQILSSLSLVSLLILCSCGIDVSTSKKKVNHNPLIGKECVSNTIYMPVCGIDLNGEEAEYENISDARCFNATNIFQGKCKCSEPNERFVCMSNKESLKECAAQDAIKKDLTGELYIEKFQACN